MMKRSYSKPLKFKEGDGFLHGFTTGMVKVKNKFRTARGNALTSKINFILDDTWTEFMPIMVWVIDHPEGVFVIDTGENAHVNDPGYFKKEGVVLNYINTRSFAFDISHREEVGPQLQRLGYAQKDISKVVLTHMHLDHFDGLSYFENTPIVVHKQEWEKPSFALPSLYPDWFTPTTQSLQASSNLPFEQSTPLVSSKEILMVHTPGHTMGHCSVLLKTDDMDYLLAGDVTYNQQQLKNNVNAGAHQSFSWSARSFKAIKKYAHQQKLVYLPSHDLQALDRLEQDDFLTV